MAANVVYDQKFYEAQQLEVSLYDGKHRMFYGWFDAWTWFFDIVGTLILTCTAAGIGGYYFSSGNLETILLVVYAGAGGIPVIGELGILGWDGFAGVYGRFCCSYNGVKDHGPMFVPSKYYTVNYVRRIQLCFVAILFAIMEFGNYSNHSNSTVHNYAYALAYILIICEGFFALMFLYTLFSACCGFDPWCGVFGGIYTAKNAQKFATEYTGQAGMPIGNGGAPTATQQNWFTRPHKANIVVIAEKEAAEKARAIELARARGEDV